jgi:tryptophanyl-tRNA synthetase
MGIVTDSKAPGEPKSTEGSALFQLYQAFASSEETAALAQAFAQGIAWGEAKQQVFERLDQEIAPMRAVYERLMQDPVHIEAVLQRGAQKARAVATPFMARVRHAVGLRPLQTTSQPASKNNKTTNYSFKQFRGTDGRFYFKWIDPQGLVLIESTGFDDPKAAASAMAQLQENGAIALKSLHSHLAHQADPAQLAAGFAAMNAR